MSGMTEPARFTSGSTMRHVSVMAGTGAIGLVAVFVVDLLNLFYISLLGQRPMAAAVGFAGAVGFLQVSIAIGMTIGVGAVVSRAIGAAREADARRIATSSLLTMIAMTAVLGLGTVAFLDPILDLLGARGETRTLAIRFLVIVSPSLALLAIGMCCASLLRCVGDARHAMNITLSAALATAAFDPLLIFGAHLGLTGAAISTVLSRTVLAFVGWHGVSRRHQLLSRIVPGALFDDIRLVSSVAVPAILTNLASPVAGAYVTRSMAQFGPAAVAGAATVDRISPVAFGLIFALSGAVGPILAQNLGAGLLDRVRDTLRNSLLFVLAAVLAAWLVLAVAQGPIVVVFSAHGIAAELIRLFCTWLAGSFLFVGALFVANAAFNNLGYPLLSTFFNWGRATLGTVPFVALGSRHGPAGILVGQAAGSLMFGILAVVVAFRVIGRLARSERQIPGMGVAIPCSSGGAALVAIISRARHRTASDR
jgi:Na+-driven multidrug efflux pump